MTPKLSKYCFSMSARMHSAGLTCFANATQPIRHEMFGRQTRTRQPAHRHQRQRLTPQQRFSEFSLGAATIVSNQSAHPHRLCESGWLLASRALLARHVSSASGDGGRAFRPPMMWSVLSTVSATADSTVTNPKPRASPVTRSLITICEASHAVRAPNDRRQNTNFGSQHTVSIVE